MTSSNTPAPEPRGHDFALDGRRRSRGLSDSSSGHRHPQSPPPIAPVSPQATRVPKKPPNLRRTSTRTPHRGQEFSVDDDPDEVEEERVSLAPHQPSFPPLNRQATIRRKPAQLAPALPRVDSQDEEDDADKVSNPPSIEPLPTDEEDEAGEGEDGDANVED